MVSTPSPGSRRRWLQAVAALVGAPLAAPGTRGAALPNAITPAIPQVAPPQVQRFAPPASAPPAAPAPRPLARQLLQFSPAAGFQYHEGEAVWHCMRTGDPLCLVREPRNRFDERAVRLEWQGEKIGYVPARDNAAVAQLLDRDECLDAVITRMAESRNPWERLEFAVYWTA
jgi:HIRAN domain